MTQLTPEAQEFEQFKAVSNLALARKASQNSLNLLRALLLALWERI